MHELSAEQRMASFHVLWHAQKDGRPVRADAERLAIQFALHKTTINRLWREMKIKLGPDLNDQNGEPVDNLAFDTLMNNVAFFESGRNLLTGRKPKWDVPALVEVVRNMPLTERQSFSQLAKNLRVDPTTRWTGFG